jgi:predicted trehalose synthase
MTKLEELEAKRVAFSVARVATEAARGACDVAMKTFEAAWIVKSTAFAAWCVAKAAYEVEIDKQERADEQRNH